MKKLSLLLVALIGSLYLSCSNDPKVEADFVKAVDEAVAKLENAKTIEEVQAFANDVEAISNNEAFISLKETGAAKEAAEKLSKAVDSMDEKMKEVAESMLNNALTDDDSNEEAKNE